MSAKAAKKSLPDRHLQTILEQQKIARDALEYIEALLFDKGFHQESGMVLAAKDLIEDGFRRLNERL